MSLVHSASLHTQPATEKPVVSGHTPGPWGWFGSQNGVYLATPDRGRTYVMGFRRMGLQGAQPTFRDGGVMRPASELVRFAVGEGVAKGFAEGRADRSVYRYDISDVDHPDARLIAAAPDLLEALILLEREMVLSGNAESRDYGWLPAITKTRAAIIKATTPAADTQPGTSNASEPKILPTNGDSQ